MAKHFALDDFLQLALALRQTVVTHNVPAKLRHSLIEDIVFHFATCIDEKTGSSFHESIFGLLDDQDLKSAPRPQDRLVAELEIVFGKGRKAEMNVLWSDLDKPGKLKLNFEVGLNLRSLAELDSRVDVDGRFEALMQRKGGIEALRFNSADNLAKPSWLLVPLQGSPYGDVPLTVAGICSCIARVSKQWL